MFSSPCSTASFVMYTGVTFSSANFAEGWCFFWRGMDPGQVHPKQTWIMEYIESANQAASFILRMEPKFTCFKRWHRKLTQKSPLKPEAHTMATQRPIPPNCSLQRIWTCAVLLKFWMVKEWTLVNVNLVLHLFVMLLRYIYIYLNLHMVYIYIYLFLEYLFEY